MTEPMTGAVAAEPRQMMDFLAAREPAMLELLREIVDIDSNSYDKAGVDAVGEAIERFLTARGIAVSRLPLSDHGDVFIAELPGSDNQAPVLLMGHRDTVFPTGEAARRPFTIRDGRAYGPGVADMKAGLVMNAFVMAAFAALKLPHPPLLALFSSDEEIGTPACKTAIRETAGRAQAVFNAEPGRISGNVVLARRGGIFFRAKVTGRAAHAGLDYERGRSAILATARKIEAWHGLTDQVADVTVNVGLVSGGQSVNTVAPGASCEIDLRYTAPADRDRLIAAITEIALAESVPETTGEIEIIGEFLPVAQDPAQGALFDLYQGCAAQAGLALEGEFTRSCADSGLTADLGIPTICATGPVGALAHSPDEYLEIATFVPRAQALALTLMSMAGNGNHA